MMALTNCTLSSIGHQANFEHFAVKQHLHSLQDNVNVHFEAVLLDGALEVDALLSVELIDVLDTNCETLIFYHNCALVWVTT